MDIIIEINQLVTIDGTAPKRGKEMDELNTIDQAYLIIDQGKIYDYGKMNSIKDLSKYDRVVNAKNKVVLPGFIDPHTHFVFSGDRSDEFKMRLEGIPYIEILKKGGGILNTVKSTREADFNSLVTTANHRLDRFLSNGVTTLEGKSGYGLDKDAEIKQLKVMKELDRRKDIDIVATFLGAHAVLEKYKDDPLEYIYYIIENVLPEVHNKELAEFCDVFCDEGAFSYQESEILLKEAKKMGFKLKIHADEIKDTNGSELAGRLGAISADHLLKASKQGLKSLKENDVVAVLLPLTAFSLKEDYAAAKKMIEMGIPIALATDLNPGSSYSQSIPLLLSLAVMYMNMSPEQAISALTINAACALDRQEHIGSISRGKEADFIIIDAPDYNHLFYNFGVNLVDKVYKNGKLVFDNTLKKRKVKGDF